jgi:hypothetical protein
MEIVTEPDVRTAEQASRRRGAPGAARAIGASDADDRGQMRVEANVSLRPRGTEAFGTRVEVKNMNSFRSVERAIAFEIERQAAALDAGETLTQDTRGWDEDRGETYVMRSKEDSHDYRYFPEPDLPSGRRGLARSNRDAPPEPRRTLAGPLRRPVSPPRRRRPRRRAEGERALRGRPPPRPRSIQGFVANWVTAPGRPPEVRSRRPQAASIRARARRPVAAAGRRASARTARKPSRRTPRMGRRSPPS